MAYSSKQSSAESIQKNFSRSKREGNFQIRVRNFMTGDTRPRIDACATALEGGERWTTLQTIEEREERAKAAGPRNLFLPPSNEAAMSIENSFVFSSKRLTNLEYVLRAGEMGRVTWVSEVFNCSAPDTGNMEVLHRYGTRDHKDRWLTLLMHGDIGSAFMMPEPNAASSDATNIQTSIRRHDDHYVITGRKWCSSDAGDPRCKIATVMGKKQARIAGRSPMTVERRAIA